MRIIWKAAITLACVGMVAPHPATWAGPSTPKKTAGVEVCDVSLRAGGVLVGQVVDAQGKTLKNAPVAVKYGEKTVAQARSDKNGRFVVKNLRGGVHQVYAGQGGTLCRFWTEKAAPPASRTGVVVVSDGSIVRGQGCATDGCAVEPGCADEGCGAVAGAGCGMLGGGGAGGLGGLGGAGGALALVAGVAVVGGVIAIAADDDDDDVGTSTPPPASP